MALYRIEYRHVEVSYASETIEADSNVEAEAIARSLLDNPDFEARINDNACFDGCENSFMTAYVVSRAVNMGGYEYERKVTLSAEEIESYIG